MGKAVKKIFKVVKSILGGGSSTKSAPLPPAPVPEPVKPLPDPMDPAVLTAKKKELADFYGRNMNARTTVLTDDEDRLG